MVGKCNPNVKIIWVRYFSKKNKVVIFRLKNPYMDANLRKTHKYLFIIIITIESCFAGRGGLGGELVGT